MKVIVESGFGKRVNPLFEEQKVKAPEVLWRKIPWFCSGGDPFCNYNFCYLP